jgi:hypothetical protein
MTGKIKVTNTFGIEVNKCCASCAHKDLTRAVTLRRCMKHCKDVGPGDVCGCWAMSRQFEMAGRSQGRVKRREYLMYLVAVREEERLRVSDGTSGMSLVEQLVHKITAKSIAQIRSEFEALHGSIYLEF